MRFVFAVLMILISVSYGNAETPLDFVMSDGSAFSATLIGARSDEFVVDSAGPFEGNELGLRADLLVRAEVATDPIDSLRESDFAFVLRDQTRYVGRPVGFERGRLRVSTISLGEVDVRVDQLLRVVRASAVECRLNSLQQSALRWRGDGWDWRNGVLASKDDLASDTPFRAIVGDLGLEERFHLRLEMVCVGDPSLQVLLGDRAEDGAGQGRGRRGSSRSLSPEEERLTGLEWFGGGASLTRRTSSVADMAVFDVGSSERLLLDLYVDQPSGLIAAYQEGRMVGSVELAEDAPTIHSTLTLISRGGSVALNSLELYRWSGRLPKSRSVQAPFTESLNGAYQGKARIDAETQWQTLKRMEWPGVFERYPTPSFEVLWPDGCRLAGEFVADEAGANCSVRALSGREFPSSPRRLSRIIRIGTQPVQQGSAVLRSGSNRLFGELVADDGALAWQASCATRAVRLDPSGEAEIEWKRESNRSHTATVLLDGQRVTGVLRDVADGGVSFEPTLSEPVRLPLGRVARIDFATVPETILNRAKSLTLPRRQVSDPPTHWVISANGDSVRGRLIACDETEMQLEVRSRIRRVPRSLIASVFRLNPPGADDASTPENQSQTWVTTVTGDELAFGTMPRSDGKTLIGEHALLGPCQIPLSNLLRLKRGVRKPDAEASIQLVPAIRPRTFDEE